MIYQKELLSPAYRRRSVRREIALFGERKGALSARGLHVRESGRGIVCAEGARSLGAERTFLLSEGHAAELFEYRDGLLLSPEGTGYPVSDVPNALLCFVSGEGKKEYFALTDDVCLHLRQEGGETAGTGGTCGAVHGERLFIAKGDRLRWSAPLAPEDPSEDVQKGGFVDLPSADGAILKAVSFKDVLYLFRERGIAVLDVLGDARAFAAKHLPAPSGIVAESVRKCGDVVRFLADDGLYTFDGKTCERSEFPFEGIALRGTAVCGGKYFAAASCRGEKCILCAEGEKIHLIRARAEKLYGGEKLLFTAEGELFELAGRGLPPMRRRECVLKTERSLLGLSSRQKYLDGILIEGRGHFRAEARGEHGMPRAVFGRAGEPLRFPLPVRGSGFTLELKTLDEDACVRAVVFDLREEVPKW